MSRATHSLGIIGSILLSCLSAPAVSASTVVDFDTTPTGYEGGPLTIGQATFDTTGYGLYIWDYGLGGNSICATQTGSQCDAALELTFASAVYGLTFEYTGTDDAASNILVNLVFLGGVTSAFSFSPLGATGFVDLSGQSNIVAATISTSDPAGLAYDNFTFRGAVPEPATWIFLILGFGLVGAKMRSGRKQSHFGPCLSARYARPEDAQNYV